jgi:hypothetical protein
MTAPALSGNVPRAALTVGARPRYNPDFVAIQSRP